MTTAFIPKTAVFSVIAETIANTNPFYPSYRLQDFREKMRVDDSVSDARAKEQLETAMMFLNAELDDGLFREQYFPDEEQLPPESEAAKWYQIALFHRAKAYIIEQYRDIDSSKSGHGRADEMETRIDTYLQRSRDAQSRLFHRTGATIALV